MKYGYVRVRHQNDDKAIGIQSRYLQGLGAEKTYVETDGSQLQILLDTLGQNDTLYVMGVDRLSRTTDTLQEIFKFLSGKGVSLFAGPERIELDRLSTTLLLAHMDALMEDRKALLKIISNTKSK